MKDATIWRYLDFTKFVDLLATESLFFCRSDKLEDPFEGSFPKKHVEKKTEEIRKNAKDFEKEIELFENAGQNFRKYVFLNCWHQSEHESAALWQLYLKSNEGIAVKSSINKLGSSCAASYSSIWTVPVWYIDYSNDDPPVPTRMAPFRYKRKSFEHESELRAIVYANTVDEKKRKLPPPSEDGIKIKVNLDQLIEAVYVAPTAPHWFHELTNNICKHYNLEADVIQSSLAVDKPVFI